MRLLERRSSANALLSLPSAFLMLGIVLGIVPVPAQAQERELFDRDIAGAVENLLSTEPAIDFGLVDIRVTSGSVALSGVTGSLPSKIEALSSAGKVKGVRSIVDSLAVKTPGRPDNELREDVKMVLTNDPAVRLYDIKVNVKGGICVLAGLVPSWQAKELVSKLARRVKGIRDVVNDCYIEPSARTDRDITEEILRRFENDAILRFSRINAGAHKGTVALTGSSGSVYEKERARTLSRVSGVTEVDDAGVKIEPSLLSGARQPRRPVPLSDGIVRDEIRHSFRYDPRLSPSVPDVEVASGIVTLSGVVANLRARSAAEIDASYVAGVARIVNRIRVRPAALPDDELLASNIKYALAADPYLYRHEITINALNGTVTLRGTVNNLFERQRAEDAASLEGVVAVKNELSLAGVVVSKGDDQIEGDIRGLIDQDVLLAGDDIAVTVSDGIATLKGTVRSLPEQEHARDLGYQGGAASVLTYFRVRQ